MSHWVWLFVLDKWIERDKRPSIFWSSRSDHPSGVISSGIGSKEDGSVVSGVASVAPTDGVQGARISSNRTDPEKASAVFSESIMSVERVGDVPSMNSPLVNSSSLSSSLMNLSSTTTPSMTHSPTAISSSSRLPPTKRRSTPPRERLIPLRPSRFGSPSQWSAFFAAFARSQRRLVNSTQKVVYLKRGTTGIAGQMIGICDAFAVAAMTQRSLQCNARNRLFSSRQRRPHRRFLRFPARRRLPSSQPFQTYR